MKPLYFLLFLLVLTLGCDKQFDYEYAVICEFPTSFTEKNRLILVAEDGTVLKEIKVAQGVGGISEKFTLRQQEPNELLSLHLLQDYTDMDGGWVQVLSHYGLRNGQPVNLNIKSDVMPLSFPSREVKLAIRDLDPNAQVHISGCSYFLAYYSPVPVFSVSLTNGQDMVVQVTTPEGTRGLYIPTEGMPDSMVVSVQQFAPFQKKIKLHLPAVHNPADSSESQFAVYAVSPGLSRHVILGIRIEAFLSSVQEVDFPNGLSADWGLYVSYSNSSYAVERTFPIGETIRLSEPSIAVVQKTLRSGQGLSIRCQGTVNWLEATSGTVVNNRPLTWTVMGRPQDLEDLHLPAAVQQHLPGGSWGDIFQFCWVRAFHAPDYGFDDMARGFPWSGDRFTVGRKGYEMVQK